MLKVLSEVNNGIDKPTRIMYASSLSWKSARRIISNLVAQGLLNEITVNNGKRSRKRYEITEKGANVLQYFSDKEDVINVLGAS